MLVFLLLFPSHLKYIWLGMQRSALVQHRSSLKGVYASFSPLHLQQRNTIAFTLLWRICESLNLIGKRVCGASAVEACQP